MIISGEEIFSRGLNNQLISGRLASPSTLETRADRLHAALAVVPQAIDRGLDPAGAGDAVAGTAFGEDGRVLHFEASDDPLVQLLGVERMDAVGFAPLGAVGAHGAVLLLNGKDARQCAIRDRARRQGEGESHYRDETPLQSGIPQTANLDRNGTESEYQNLGYGRF